MTIFDLKLGNQYPSAWAQSKRRRRAGAAVIGVAVHGGLLLALLSAHIDVQVPVQPSTVWTNLLPMAPSPLLPLPLSLPRPSPNRTEQPRRVVVPPARVAMPTQQEPAAWAAAVPASGASAPLATDSASTRLRLTLTPGELRALEAGTPRTLAQRLAPPSATPLLAQRLAPAPQFEEDDRSGIHTVHSHGGCYILVPSGQAKADPFNHGGERLTGRATNDNC